MKPSSTQEPSSSSARHTMLILQQNRNTTLNIKRQAAQSPTKPIDTQKLTTGHFIAPQREDIQLQPPEHRHKFPQTVNPEKPLEQTPQLRWTTTLQQAKQKRKRQRNIQQLKEHNKNPPNQTKEEEIGNLPEKELRIMIVKWSKTLKTKWSYR